MARDGGRLNQRLRTRKDLLEAALKLSAKGRQPSLEDVAEAAMVSRATIYRYFPSADALLAEASLHVAFPDTDELFENSDSIDPVERLERLDEATDAMIKNNEAALRVMIAGAARRAEIDSEIPARQNRRSGAIAAALAPCQDQFGPAALDSLQKALALVIGPEAMIAFKDVLRLGDEEASDVRRWIIQALVDKARHTHAPAD